MHRRKLMAKVTKNNNLNAVGGNTGGLPVIHNVSTGESELKVPTPKTEPKELGLAKASPAFKPLAPKVKASKEEEEAALKKNTVVDKGNASISPQNETIKAPENN
jgi:hypothetical protein